MAQRGRGLHHHRRRAGRLQAPADRRRARAVHRAVLAAPRSHSGHRRERIQGRALPPHRLRQRALCVGHSRLEDRPRPHLHHVRSAGRNRRPLLGRLLRAASGRRRRRDLHLPVPAVALSLHRRHRQQHHHRIRRPHHVGRVPHDHGPVGKGRPAVRSRRRSHPDGADGAFRQDRSVSTTPTARTWDSRSAASRRA